MNIVVTKNFLVSVTKEEYNAFTVAINVLNEIVKTPMVESAMNDIAPVWVDSVIEALEKIQERFNKVIMLE